MSGFFSFYYNRSMENLTPAPWTCEYFEVHDQYDVSSGPVNDASERFSILETLKKSDAEFIALARDAFDVMIKRGWNPIKLPQGEWVVREMNNSQHSRGSEGWSDPFTALVEADKYSNKFLS
jgi:hypothetical protein